MNWLPILPILIPLVTMALIVVARRHSTAQRILSVIGSTAVFATALVLFQSVYARGILVVQLGDWPAPYGITLVADAFSALMVLLAGFIGFMVSVYSLGTIDQEREAYGYYSLLQVLQMGICGAFLTGDIFNLYVFFEIMLMASFALLALGGGRSQTEGAIKYMVLNLMASSLFLAATGILYGMIGTLNMADLAVKLQDVAQPGYVTLLAMMFFIAFGIKAAMFPLFFWLPASYHTPPAAVSGIFAALLTKVGVYSMMRVFTLMFIGDIGFTHAIILFISGMTMLTGVLGAAAQFEFRRILSFHSVSQIGYMLMGLGLFSPVALAGSVFFLVHHAVVKSNLFLISGITHRISGTYELKHMGGLYQKFPGISMLFLLSALSLAGLPPLSGFFAKLMLVSAGLKTQNYIIVTVALLVSILTLFSMIKIWAEAFLKDPGLQQATNENLDSGNFFSSRYRYFAALAPVTVLSVLALLFGLGAEPLIEAATRIADELLDPSKYIHAVLGR